MESRKPTSTAKLKQELPKDSIKLIREVIEKNFPQLSKDNEVVVKGQLFPQEILLLIGFRKKEGIKQSNFLSSIDHNLKKKNTMSQIYLSVDAIGSMIQQFVEADEDIELPGDWTEFSLEGQKIFMRFDTANTELEEKANLLLDPEE